MEKKNFSDPENFKYVWGYHHEVSENRHSAVKLAQQPPALFPF